MTTARTPESSTVLSVDDILADLTKLSAKDQSSPTPSTHPLLALGNTLLPANLQGKSQGREGVDGISTGKTPLSALDQQLEEAIASLDQTQTDKSQNAALHLSSVYLDSTRQLLALGQDRADGQGDEVGGPFDSLHRRVAKLQSSNEGYMSRLQELRDVVATDEE